MALWNWWFHARSAPALTHRGTCSQTLWLLKVWSVINASIWNLWDKALMLLQCCMCFIWIAQLTLSRKPVFWLLFYSLRCVHFNNCVLQNIHMSNKNLRTISNMNATPPLLCNSCLCVKSHCNLRYCMYIAINCSHTNMALLVTLLCVYLYVDFKVRPGY